MKKALIVDDYPCIRLALNYTLGKLNFEQIDECNNAFGTIRLIKKNSYDIVIFDIGIPSMDGMSVMNTLLKVDISSRILVFTSQPLDIYEPRCRVAGASGYISKNDGMDNFFNAVKAITSGYKFFPYTTTRACKSESQTRQLSNRELDVLRKIVIGMTNNKIADTMCLSNKTISTYKTRIMEKLGVSTLVDLLKVAKRENIS